MHGWEGRELRAAFHHRGMFIHSRGESWGGLNSTYGPSDGGAVCREPSGRMAMRCFAALRPSRGRQEAFAPTRPSERLFLRITAYDFCSASCGARSPHLRE